MVSNGFSMSSSSCRPLKTLLARALFDNAGELPQELSFKRGEILTVLKQNPEGYDGWWICNHRGKVGIAPGNRLDVLGMLKNKEPTHSESSSGDGSYESPKDLQITISNNESNRESIYENLPSTPYVEMADTKMASSSKNTVDEYVLPRDSLAPNNNESNRSSGISLTYHPTSGHTTAECSPNDQYSIPNNSVSKSTVVGNNDRTANSSNSSLNSSAHHERGKLSVRFKDDTDYYNLGAPPVTTSSLQPTSRDYGDEETSSGGSGASSAISCDSASTSSSAAVHFKLLDNLKRLSVCSNDSVDSKDLPQNIGQPIRLPRALALERFASLQTNLSSTSNTLFHFINSRWKTEDSLKTTASTIQKTCQTHLTTLVDLLQFLHQTLENANECVDRALPKKIWKHLKPLDEYANTLVNAVSKLDFVSWRPSDIARLANNPDTDFLSSIVNTTRNINIEVRSLSSAIHGNATLLFVDKTPLSALQLSASSSDDALKRISADSSSTSRRRPDWSPRRAALSTSNSGDNIAAAMSSGTSHILQLYSVQVNSHCTVLDSTIADFRNCLDQNQAPSVFVAHSKFLLRSATQLVYIANGLCAGLEGTKASRTKNQIEAQGNELCEVLKVLINETKVAAAAYPQISAKQRLLGVTVQVNEAANSLKTTINNAASEKLVVSR